MDTARCKGSRTLNDPRLTAIPDVHGHAKGEHKSFAEERPIAYSPRMLFLWFYHACQRGAPRFMMVADHINYLTFEDPGAVHTVRRALKLAEAGDLYGAAETAGVEVAHAAAVSQGIRRGMRFSIGAEVDNDPRARPDAQNIVDAMRPDGIIRSVHFLTIDHPEKGADFQWPFDNPEFADLYDVVGTERVWELYMAKLLDDIEKLPGHVVGHFYVPAKFGHWPEQHKLEKYEDQMLDACAARGMAVEINTRLLYRQNDPEATARYMDALARLIRKAKAKDVGIAFGADAHSPKDQGNGFAQILPLLDQADINELVFPVGGRLARVALRATKEHLQKVAAQAPQPLPGSSITGLSRAELGLPERDEAEEREEREREAAAAAEVKRARKTAAAAKAPKVPKEPKAPKEPKTPKEPKPAKAAKALKAPGEAALPAAAEPPKLPAAKVKPLPKAQPKPKAEPKVKAVPKTAIKSAAAAAKPAAKTAVKAATTVAKATAKAAKATAKTVKTAIKKVAPAKKAAAAKKTAPAKKTSAVKKTSAAKKTAVKKTAAKKTAPARKSAAKKSAVKKSARKVTTPKRTAAKKKSTSKRR